MEEKVSIILVNYNGLAYNDKCIESIMKSTVNNRLQIVVVDNASTDDSLAELKNHWGKNDCVSIIELDQNYGFSKANNEGIKWSVERGIDRFLLLNNDTEIEPGAIEKMLEIQNNTGNIVVPKILYADKADTIWCAGGDFSTIIKKPRQRGLNQTDRGQFDKNCECEFANGCCLLLSKEIIDKIGMLDEKFFLYYEDTEYSLRAQKNGVKISYCSEAVIYHKVNGSTKGNEKPENVYYISRNWLLCNKMHLGKRFYLFFLYYLLNRIVWIAIWGMRGKLNMVLAVLDGICDYKAGKHGKWETVI